MISTRVRPQFVSRIWVAQYLVCVRSVFIDDCLSFLSLTIVLSVCLSVSELRLLLTPLLSSKFSDDGFPFMFTYIQNLIKSMNSIPTGEIASDRILFDLSIYQDVDILKEKPYH